MTCQRTQLILAFCVRLTILDMRFSICVDATQHHLFPMVAPLNCAFGTSAGLEKRARQDNV